MKQLSLGYLFQIGVQIREMGDKPAENVANGSLAKQPQTTDYETVFTAAKAGMDQVDRDKVKQLVYEMSKDSAHFKNEQRKMEQTEQKIKRMKAQAETLTSAELQNYTSLADIKIAELEATRDLTRTWIHVDMDAFFASVEELQNPSLVCVFIISLYQLVNLTAVLFIYCRKARHLQLGELG